MVRVVGESVGSVHLGDRGFARLVTSLGFALRNLSGSFFSLVDKVRLMLVL